MPADPTFRMTVQETLSIIGRGTVVTGQVESGTVSVGDEIQITGNSVSRGTLVNGIEINRRVVTHAGKGDSIGIMLREINKDEVHQGDVLSGSDFDYTWKE